MKLVKLLVGLVCVSLVSCATEDEKMQRYISGNWETIFVKIELNSYRGKDTLIEYAIDFENPEDPRAKQQGKSYATYKEDGTFTTWTEKNNIRTGNVTSGKWKATKDSLYYYLSQGEKEMTIPFELTQIEDGFSMRALQDRDSDGERDDVFYLETVRLPDTKK